MELLVGMVLAMLVAIAAFASLRSFHQLAAGAAEMSRLQRQGDFALHLIGQHLRQAGAIDPTFEPATGLHAFRGDGESGAANSAPLSGSDGADGRPGTLSVALAPARGSAAAKAPLLYDCSGAAIEGAQRVSTRFDVSPGGSLMCNARTRQPIIDEVADFQLSYRVQTASGLQTMKASAVEALRLWPEVRAVEVCLELASEERAMPAPIASRGCNGEVIRARRLHRVFRQLFSLRASVD